MQFTITSSQLIKLCLTILRHHKRLFVFGFASYVSKSIIATLIITPFVYREESKISSNGMNGHDIFILYVVFLLLFFVTHVITFFFNSMSIANLLKSFDSQSEPSLLYGVKQACKRFFKIYMWASYRAMYGIWIGLLPRNKKPSERLQKTLKLNHWRIAANLALPVIMAQNTGPFKTIKESSRLMYETWGENLRRHYSFGAIFVLVELICFIPIIACSLHGGRDVIITGAILTIAPLLLVSTFMHMITTTLRVAVYCYADKKRVVAPFTEEIMADLFREVPWTEDD